MARGADFLRANLPQHAGTWLSGPQFADTTLTCGAYMILPLAFTAANRRADAVAAMDYIADHFFASSDAGDGCDGGNAALGWMSAYQPAWACVTAVQMGRPDVAQKLVRRVLAFQGTGALGGFYGGRKARRSSAEHLIATKALLCTATAWMLTAAESFAKF